MTTKSKIFGKIDNISYLDIDGLDIDGEVEIVAETSIDFIIVHPEGWRMGRCRELGMQKPFTFFREVEDSETCLFIAKSKVRLWNQDTKLGGLL